MPLHDAAANIPRKDNSIKIDCKPTNNPISLSSNGLLPPPIAIQSMLRTATEVGDVGHFNHKSRNTIRPGSRIQSTRRRSGSFDSSFASALRHNHSPRYRPGREHNKPRNFVPTSRLVRHDTTWSNPSSYGHSERMRYEGPARHQQQQQQIFAGFKPTSHSLHNQRSLLTLRSFGGAGSRHSSSSSNHPTFTEILRHYPSSSIFSNGDNIRKQSAFIPNRRSTASPSAAAAIHAGYQSYNLSNNESIISSMPISSPKSSDGRLPAKEPPFTYFRSAYISRNQRVAGSGMRQFRTLRSTSTITDSAARTTPYYDYTESFVVEDCFSPDMRFSNSAQLQSLDQTISSSYPMNSIIRAQTPFGIRLGSEFLPAELPATIHEQFEDFSNQQNMQIHGHEDPVNSSPMHSIPVELPVNNLRSTSNGLAQRGPFELDANTAPTHRRPYRASAKLSSNAFFMKGEKSQRDLTALAARIHFPVLGEASQTKSSANYQGATKASPESKTSNTKNDLLLVEQMSCGLQRIDLTTSEDSRPSSSPATINKIIPTVICPQPHRPVSSQSQMQFKNILGYEQKSGESTGRSLCSDRALLNKSRSWPIQENPTPAFQIGKLDSESLIIHKTSPVRAEIFSDASTPKQRFHLSVIDSHGKSTVESLLDKHIACLGLMPDSGSSSGSSTQTYSDQLAASNDKIYTPGWPLSSSETQLLPNSMPVSMDTRHASSLSPDTRSKLKPRKLFADTDGVAFACRDALTSAQNVSLALSHALSFGPSYGWQILPSSSQNFPTTDSNRPTITPGEMADVDTDECRFGRRIWRLSQLSLPTSFEEQVSVVHTEHSRRHRRTRSEMIARQESHRRRRFRILLNKKIAPNKTGKTLTSYHHTSSDRSETPLHDAQPTFVRLCAELDASQTASTPNKKMEQHDFLIPDAQSDLKPTVVAGYDATKVVRKRSTRTHRSQASQCSQRSVINPLNSTRQLGQLSRCNDQIPKLASPDFGPPLDTSVLNLSIPEAEASSTIHPSPYGGVSFFDDSPSPKTPKGRRQFGLRPLRHAMYGSRGSPVHLIAGMPMRNGIPIAAVGSTDARLIGRRPVHCMPISMSQMAFSSKVGRKRRVIDRFKDWWKGQCMLGAAPNRRK